MCCGGRTHIGVFGHALGMGGHALWWADTRWGVRTCIGDGWTRVVVFGHGLGMVGHGLGMVGHGLGWADTGLGWADGFANPLCSL
jgi:hypothetical protein